MTHLIVLCSISSSQINYCQMVETAHHFFITICVASGSGEMEVYVNDELIISKINLILEKNFDADIINIDYTNVSFRNIGLDSLDIIKFIVKIEECFNILISDNEMEAMNNVDDIIYIIKNKSNQN